MPRHACIVALAVMALAAVAFGQEIVPNPRAPWRLTEVARAECRGGAFFGASIAADSTRMLTIGEGGVAILWDLVRAEERKRFAALDGATAVCMHPNDPWALVFAGDRPPHAHRLDFGTGNYTKLWDEPVNRAAFDAAGARVAVVFTDPNRGSRLAVYPEAALRASRPPPPDFVREFPREWPDRVFFHPRDDVVFLGSHGTVLRVHFRGGTTTNANPELRGFLADGTEVVKTRDRDCPTATGMHWLAGYGQLQRGGIECAAWTIDAPYGTSALATDGTVVAPDERGLLHLLGPDPERRRSVRGQQGPALQLCFDASGRHLAVVGGCMLTLLDVANGTTTRVDGSFAVHASTSPGEFVVLDGRTLATIRAADHWGRTPIATLPANTAATTFERTRDEAVVRPFQWIPKRRRLWLGDVGSSQPACFMAGRFAALSLPFAADAYSQQRGLALGAGRDGDTLLATTTPRLWCGTGLDRYRWWSTLRTFDNTGHLRRSLALPNVIDWMATSPSGATVAVPAPDGRVAIYAADDLHPIHDVDLGYGPIVALQFVDERTALASNGVTLLHVRIAAGAARAIPVALPGPITRLCLSPDRRLVAIACGSDVRVLRRR